MTDTTIPSPAVAAKNKLFEVAEKSANDAEAQKAAIDAVLETAKAMNEEIAEDTSALAPVEVVVPPVIVQPVEIIEPAVVPPVVETTSAPQPLPPIVQPPFTPPSPVPTTTQTS